MEKLGIAKEDLLEELKKEYLEVTEAMSVHVKLGFRNNESMRLEKRLETVKAKIEEVEKS